MALVCSPCLLHAGDREPGSKEAPGRGAEAAQEPQKTGEKAAETKEAKKREWYEAMKLSGDFRLRYEYIGQPSWDPEVRDRHRPRIRARIGLDAPVFDDLDFKLRMATAESVNAGTGADPVSTNMTMTNGDSKKGIWLDLAQLEYHPSAVKGLKLLFGKMENPYLLPGKSDLVWDHDLTPEGAALKYTLEQGVFSLQTILGGFLLMERSAETDAGVFGIQAILRFKLPANIYLLGGVGYFDFVNTRHKPVFDYTGTGKSFGNTKTGGDYAHDYNELELFFEAGFEVPAGDKAIPVQVFVHSVQNMATHVDENFGWIAGACIGKADKPLSFALKYNYRELRKDAVVGAFTDSDSFGGGTDGRGHKVSLEVVPFKNVTLGVSYFHDEARISTTNAQNRRGAYRRLQVDLAVKF